MRQQIISAMKHSGRPMWLAGLALLLAGCVNNNNWWDENGAARHRDGTYVAGTPLPAPDRNRSYSSASSTNRNSTTNSSTRNVTSSGGGTHVVKRGETLYQVSRDEHVPLRSLIEANKLQPPYELQTGQRLTIPSARYHVVVRGDTVYSISRAYGVDMATLTSTNGIAQPYTITLGQRLQLPSQVNNQVTASANDDRPPPAGVPVGRPANTSTYVANAPALPAARPSSGYKAPLPAPPAAAGDFIWPAQGRIISNYGPKEGGTHNDGINIAVPAGSPVKAAQNGVVAYAGNELKGYGNLLLVRHSNGWMTAYAHNSKLLVKRGETVVRGQTISQAGSTGSVSTPQVHFELRKGAKAVDPRTVIGG